MLGRLAPVRAAKGYYKLGRTSTCSTLGGKPSGRSLTYPGPAVGGVSRPSIPSICGYEIMAFPFEKRKFCRSLQKARCPIFREDDLEAWPAPASVRRPCLPEGKLIEEFFISKEAPGILHVVNAPSPRRPPLHSPSVSKDFWKKVF